MLLRLFFGFCFLGSLFCNGNVLDDLIISYNLTFLETMDLPCFSITDDEIVMCIGFVDNDHFVHLVYLRDELPILNKTMSQMHYNHYINPPILFDCDDNNKLVNISYFMKFHSPIHKEMLEYTENASHLFMNQYISLLIQKKFIKEFCETKREHSLTNIGLAIKHSSLNDNNEIKEKVYECDYENRAHHERLIKKLDVEKVENYPPLITIILMYVVPITVILIVLIYMSYEDYKHKNKRKYD